MVQLVKRASDVRITEINLSSIILANSSASAAIPIISARGSTRPLRFSNVTAFLQEYGNPDPSKSSTIQAGMNYFTEGNDLWGIRVVNSGYKTSGLVLYVDSATGATGFVPAPTVDPTNALLTSFVTGTQVAVALIYAGSGPGSYGDQIGVSTTNNDVVPPTVTASATPTGGTLASGTAIYRVTAIGASGESLPTTVSAAVTGPVGSVTLSWAAVPGARGYNIYGRTAGAGFLVVVGSAATSYVDTGSAVANPLRVPPITQTKTDQFTVNVWDLADPQARALETWVCSLVPVLDGSGTSLEIQDRINPFSSQIQVVSIAETLLPLPSIGTSSIVALAGGTSGVAPTSFNVVSAMQVFTNKQLYPCNIFINGGLSDPIVQGGLDALVQGRGDSISLLDVPSSRQAYQSAIDYRNLDLNLNSTYSALFAPDLLQADLINGKQVYNPPSGWAAALCARTDKIANPAFSIAGLNRGLLPVLKARYQYDDGAASAMYSAQVNYSRTFVGQGIALWEQLTLSGQNSALSWLSVRRIVNVIKVSMYQFLLYALQEMNNDQIRKQLVNSSNAYLQSIKDAQGLSDFQVFCDDRNNTPTTFNAGILVLTVILIPAIPIHEIQLQIVISKQGVSFNEALSAVTGKTQ